jgi:hypothetical protein
MDATAHQEEVNLFGYLKLRFEAVRVAFDAERIRQVVAEAKATAPCRQAAVDRLAARLLPLIVSAPSEALIRLSR